MRKIVICTLVISLCLFACSCYNPKNYHSSELKNIEIMNSKATLRVNEKNISCDETVLINYSKQYAELPLIAVLKALGADIKWVNKKKVTIFISDTTYILNPQKNILQKQGESFNMIAVPPGTKHRGVYKVQNQEFIIDSNSVYYFINSLGYKITIDYDNAVVNIEKRQNE